MNKKHMCEARAKKGLAPVYVAVYDYSGDYAYLEDEYILGWSNRSDWYTDICGDEILTPSGNLKKSTTDFIQVGRGDGALVSRDFAYVKEYAAGAIEEGDNLTVCELKKDDEDAWILVRAEGGASNLEESSIKIHERKFGAKKLTYYWIFKDGDNGIDAGSPKAYDEALNEILAYIKNLTPAEKEGFGLTWDWYEGEDAEGSLILWVRTKEECEEEGISLSKRVEAESGHEKAAAAIIKALSSVSEKNKTRYFYVICKMYGKIVAHGDIEVDLTKLSAHETASERAMTDYFDGTEIAYSGEYDDENGEFDWDALERFVIEIDKNEALPKTDEEAEKFLQDAEIALEESFIKLHERESTAKNKNLVEVYKILDKYGRVDEDVDVVFRRASLTEQQQMVKLLREDANQQTSYNKLDRLVNAYNSKYAGWNGWYPEVLKVTCTEEEDYGASVQLHLSRKLSSWQQNIFIVRFFEDYIADNIEFDALLEDTGLGENNTLWISELTLENVGVI